MTIRRTLFATLCICAGAAPLARAQEGEAPSMHPLLRTVDQIQRQTPSLRGLALLEHVPADVMDRGQLEGLIMKMLREEYPPEQIELTEKAYKALGLIGPEVDIIKAYSAFATSQVAAFYEPKTKRIYVLDDLPEAVAGMIPGLDEALAEAVVEPMITNTLAHEFTHALQDQHFDLSRMLDAVMHDDDMALAVHALIEGDAMIAGTAVMLGSAQQATAMSTEGAALSGAGAAIAPGLGEAPAIFRDTLIFPYIHGWVFALSLANDGGFAAVDAAFADPPISTEQVLHPEKYAERDVPQRVTLPDLSGIVEARLVGANVMGELQTRILLGNSPDAHLGAEGWDGDACAVYEAPGEAPLTDRLRFVWVSVWDSEQDAAEFGAEYASALRRRAAARTGAYPTIERQNADGVRTWQMTTQPGVALVEQTGDRVIAVEGFDAGQATAVLEALRAATTAPKQLELPPADPAETP